MSQELYAKWLPIDKPLILQRRINSNLKGPLIITSRDEIKFSLVLLPWERGLSL